jgi:hypothetical protein
MSKPRNHQRRKAIKKVREDRMIKGYQAAIEKGVPPEYLEGALSNGERKRLRQALKKSNS